MLCWRHQLTSDCHQLRCPGIVYHQKHLRLLVYTIFLIVTTKGWNREVIRSLAVGYWAAVSISRSAGGGSSCPMTRTPPPNCQDGQVRPAIQLTWRMQAGHHHKNGHRYTATPNSLPIEPKENPHEEVREGLLTELKLGWKQVITGSWWWLETFNKAHIRLFTLQ